MKNQLLVNDIKFWVDQNIIYCELSQYSNLDFSEEYLIDLFYESISILSQETFYPIVFDFRELKSSQSMRFFKILSNNSKIKSSVLSKAFLVKGIKQKILLNLNVMFGDCDFSNLVFSDLELANNFCKQSLATFNSVSGDSEYGKCN